MSIPPQRAVKAWAGSAHVPAGGRQGGVHHTDCCAVLVVEELLHERGVVGKVAHRMLGGAESLRASRQQVARSAWEWAGTPMPSDPGTNRVVVVAEHARDGNGQLEVQAVVERLGQLEEQVWVHDCR